MPWLLVSTEALHPPAPYKLAYGVYQGVWDAVAAGRQYRLRPPLP